MSTPAENPRPRVPASPYSGLSFIQQALTLCSECLEKQENVLADTHLDRLRVLAAAVEALSRLRCFPEAAAYARRMVQGYT